MLLHTSAGPREFRAPDASVIQCTEPFRRHLETDIVRRNCRTQLLLQINSQRRLRTGAARCSGRGHNYETTRLINSNKRVIGCFKRYYAFVYELNRLSLVKTPAGGRETRRSVGTQEVN